MSRAMGLKGRVQPQLDDTIVPVVLNYDLTRAPWRSDEQKFFAAIPISTSAAADTSVVAILNKGTRPVVVEWWRIINRGGGSMRVAVEMVPRAQVDALAAINDTAFTAYENGFGTTNPGTIRNDVVLREGRVVGGPFPQVGNFVDIIDLPVFSATTPAWVLSAPDFDLVIPPGAALVFPSSAVNDALGIAAQLRISNALGGS